MKKALPSLVLTLVCAVVCGLLAVVNAVTKDKIAQAEADKLQDSLTTIFGEGRYTALETIPESEHCTITAVYESEDGILIFDITADGYAKDGIRALIGVNPDESVHRVGIVSLGETPGVGSKINDEGYLSGFAGIAGFKEAHDVISGATYSSNGLRQAVDAALTAAHQLKEVQ